MRTDLALVFAAFSAGLAAPVWADNRVRAETRMTVSLLPIAFATAGLVSLAVNLLDDNRAQELYDAYRGQDLSTEPGRAQAFVKYRARFEKLARNEAYWRQFGGWVGLGVGAILVGYSAQDIANWKEVYARYDEISGMALGASFMVTGIFALAALRTPAERTWELYASEGSPPETPDDKVTVAPTVGLLDGGGALGLSLRF